MYTFAEIIGGVATILNFVAMAVGAADGQFFIGGAWALTGWVLSNALDAAILKRAGASRVLETLASMALNDAGFFHFFNGDSGTVDGFYIFEQFDVGGRVESDPVERGRLLARIALHVTGNESLSADIAVDAGLSDGVSNCSDVIFVDAKVESAHNERVAFGSPFSKCTELGLDLVDLLDNAALVAALLA